MGLVSEVFKTIRDVSSASAEATMAQWQIIVGGLLTVFVLLTLIILLVLAPQIGIALAIIIVAALYTLAQGDNDVI